MAWDDFVGFTYNLLGQTRAPSSTTTPAHATGLDNRPIADDHDCAYDAEGIRDFVDAVRAGKSPIDIYDAVAWTSGATAFGGLHPRGV